MEEVGEKRTCPNCKAEFKIILRCPLCFDLTCSNCSIEKICIDCYVDLRKMDEVNAYFTDKYGAII